MLSFNGVDTPNLTVEKKVKLETEPAMLCWFLFLESDVEFAKYVTDYRKTIDRMTGDFLTVNIFETADKSSEEMATLVSRALEIGLTDFPVAVFFDSFSNTTAVEYYRFKGKDHDQLNAEMKFIVDCVKKYWQAIPNIGILNTEEIITERRNCIGAMKPQILLKRVKNFASDNRSDITRIVQWLTRPFTGL